MRHWILESHDSNLDYISIYHMNEFRPYFIGRNNEADIRIDSRDVSRSHAVVRLKYDGKIYLEDLNSKRGTYVNDFKLSPLVEVLLLDGDMVSFGGPSTSNGVIETTFKIHFRRREPLSPVSTDSEFDAEEDNINDVSTNMNSTGEAENNESQVENNVAVPNGSNANSQLNADEELAHLAFLEPVDDKEEENEESPSKKERASENADEDKTGNRHAEPNGSNVNSQLNADEENAHSAVLEQVDDTEEGEESPNKKKRDSENAEEDKTGEDNAHTAVLEPVDDKEEEESPNKKKRGSENAEEDKTGDSEEAAPSKKPKLDE